MRSAYDPLDPAARTFYSELLESSLADEAGYVGTPPPGGLVTQEMRK